MELLQTLDMSWCKPTGDIGTVQDIISTVILIIQVAVPILLIIFGMIDLGKAVVASKEDEIKKGQQTFIKRLIAAVIVFLVIFIVKIVISIVAKSTVEGEDNMWNCISCFTGGTDNADCKKVR